MNTENFCSICFKVPTHPKRLLCNHIFCLHCLTNNLLKSYDQSVLKNGIRCPSCNTVTSVTVNVIKSGFKSLMKVLVNTNDGPSYSSGMDSHSNYELDDVSGLKSNDILFPSAFRFGDKSAFAQSAEVSNTMCRCDFTKDWLCSTCHESFCEFCVGKHLEKPLPNAGMVHEVFNPSLCIYCSRPKVWRCVQCDRPICSNCLPVHLDQYSNHEVENLTEQSSDILPHETSLQATPSAPVYYSSTVNTYDTVPQEKFTSTSVKPKFKSEEQEPHSYYNVTNSGAPVPQLPSRPEPNFPPRTNVVIKLPSHSRVKKFCIDTAGQIFVLFHENEKEISKYDFNTGQYLSTIHTQMQIHDIDYSERNDAILTLASNDDGLASVNQCYFLQKYSIFDSNLMDVNSVGAEWCRFIAADKKHHHRVYIAMGDKIKVFNLSSKCFENVYESVPQMPDFAKLTSVCTTEKGSLYLHFGKKCKDQSCSLFAFHSIPVPVPVPLVLPEDLTDFAISGSGTICFTHPKERRVLVFEKGSTKELLQITDEITKANCYSWKPLYVRFYEEQLLIVDEESNSLLYTSIGETSC